ncbi:MAG: hypothetical protein C5S40_06230 [ANME-2 cluster archaeon]|nr:hypothetical protein [ANME-2 cluster archaeon]
MRYGFSTLNHDNCKRCVEPIEHLKKCKRCVEPFHIGITGKIVGKATFSNISALLSKLDQAQHSDLILIIFLEVSI